MAKSISERVYETQVPSIFDGYYLGLWDKEVHSFNPEWEFFNQNPHKFKIRLPPGIKFRVVDIVKNFNCKIGTSYWLTVELLNDSYIDADTPLYETRYHKNKYINKNVTDYDGYYTYDKITLQNSNNEKLTSLINGNIIRLTGLNLTLSMLSDFFTLSDGDNIRLIPKSNILN